MRGLAPKARKFHMIRFMASILALILVLSALAGCKSSDGGKTFTILSGSENKALEPIVAKIVKDEGYNVQFEYKGSIDSMSLLQTESDRFDAVWLASRFWIDLGDKDKKVKYAKSVMTSPIAFGITKSKAEKLGFVGREVKIRDIQKAVIDKKLRFMMTSATQSNSGLSAYLGFLHAFLNKDQAVTKEDLQNEDLRGQVKQLLQGVNRSSGSSGWLKDLFLKGDGSYNAMVNYEAVLIETNQELVKEGKEPLYIVYPVDGLSIADFTLGYIDNGDKDKEAFFRKLQDALLAEPAQKEIGALGRRTGFGGVVSSVDPKVFNPDWGIDLNRPISPIPFPSTDVVLEAMNLYQTALKKPSYTVYVLDYSGSMAENGEQQLKKAMRTILNQQEASKYLLQSSKEDVVTAIPFSDHVIDVWEANRLEDYDDLLGKIENLAAGGGTDIYTASVKALEQIKGVDAEKYNIAVILMTDGKSDGSYEKFERLYGALGRDVPVFPIMFGDASEDQLVRLSDLTRGKLFDGTKDLISAFKEAKGYN
ncbi:VWA domain-containing protein [Gorillibacterium massiliense]|uniref:VWA domain-containing protein n=1 Tax=Gorillibacterium massiliense TaxID=1280390 RepID=UPI00069472E5|nr:VWA domain-containing protein [Gorillibacterium massiliense]